MFTPVVYVASAREVSDLIAEALGSMLLRQRDDRSDGGQNGSYRTPGGSRSDWPRCPSDLYPSIGVTVAGGQTKRPTVRQCPTYRRLSLEA